MKTGDPASETANKAAADVLRVKSAQLAALFQTDKDKA